MPQPRKDKVQEPRCGNCRFSYDRTGNDAPLVECRIKLPPVVRATAYACTVNAMNVCDLHKPKR
jgi:hypothetical protein